MDEQAEAFRDGSLITWDKEVDDGGGGEGEREGSGIKSSGIGRHRDLFFKTSKRITHAIVYFAINIHLYKLHLYSFIYISSGESKLTCACSSAVLSVVF